MKNTKAQLKKLMELNNCKADEYLTKFACEIFDNIKKAQDNDYAFENLGLLSEFVYKVPKETIEIVGYIIKKELKPATVHKSSFGEFEGKSHKDLILKSIELLSHIRYIVPDEVLELVAQLSKWEDLEIKTKALEVVKKFAKYDYNYIKQVKNYIPQRKSLDFVLAWSRKEQLQNIDFTETVLKELLNSSAEGSTSGLNDNADYTLTMHFSYVSPTPFLIKMRRESIDLTYELYKATEDPKLKLRIVEILDEATRTPSNVAYKDDLTQMIADDFKYLSGIYRKIIFGEKGDKMIDYLGIVADIEERIYWVNRNEEKRIEESEKLRNDILQDDMYKLFRLLVGDIIVYREESGVNGWDEAEKNRTKKIDQLIELISDENIEEWFSKLNKIAAQQSFIEEWKFNTFKNFLRKLSETKPEIADNILQKSFETNSPLKQFIGSFMDGFRSGSHFEKWDKYTDKIIDAKNASLIPAIIFSFVLPANADLEKLIREKDIDILESMVKREKKLSFIKKMNEQLLHYALINALTYNFKRFPERIENLIVCELRGNSKYLNSFFNEFQTAIHRNLISVNDLNIETIELLREKIIELSGLDWHVQELLLMIGQKYGLNIVLSVFKERIQRDIKGKEKIKRNKDERYEPIPFHINPELSKFVVEHSDYEKIAMEWLSEMSTDWSINNWHVSHLFQRFGKGFDKVLTLIIQKGGDDNLMRAARAIHSIDGTNLNLCIEIVRKTDNKGILSQVDSNIYTTGVVSGEYGIAQAYENKAKTLEKYKTDESEQVRKFANKMIKRLLDSAKRERQRADEEKQLRKIEFEG